MLPLLFLPEWANGFNFLIGVFGFVVVLIGFWVTYTVRSRSEVSTLQTDRATAAEALLKIRDNELASATAKLAEVEEELESVTAELRTVTGLKIAELVVYWSEREDKFALIQDLEHQIRVLRKRKDGDTE